MNRVIKFRGWSVNANRWVYGSLITPAISCQCAIDEFGGIWYEVAPESVGQFTGLTDKNGNDVYDGDIIGSSVSVGDVQFSHGVFGIEWSHTKKKKSLIGSFGQLHNLRTMSDDILTRCEIIGNIYQNPELLCEPNT